MVINVGQNGSESLDAEWGRLMKIAGKFSSDTMSCSEVDRCFKFKNQVANSLKIFLVISYILNPATS